MNGKETEFQEGDAFPKTLRLTLGTRKLIYGSGLRLMEALRLRVKDIDFGQGTIIVNDGKGGKVSTTMIYLHVMKRPGAGGPGPLDLA